MRLCIRCERPLGAAGWACTACGFGPDAHEGISVLSPELAADPDGWDATFADRLARAESDHFWFKGRNDLIIWALRHYFPDARLFLDVGCGTGAVLAALRRRLPEATVMGTDGSPESLALAARRVDGVEYIQCDARRLPFEAEFDVVGAFDVIEHIEEDEAVLGRLFRALRPGGGALITVPQHRWLWSVADDYSYHKRRYTRAELVNKVQAAGFTVERATSFVSLLLPLLIVSRALMSKCVEDFDPLTEYRMSRVTSAALYRILRAELGLIRWGVNWPAGGSLLVIARRPGQAGE